MDTAAGSWMTTSYVFHSAEEAKRFGGEFRRGAAQLSIVIPAFNVENVVADTCNALVSNARHTSIDVILINDGSSDNTVAVARSVLERGGVPCTIVTIPNSGLSAARNVGLAFAAAPYIAFLDADDLFAPDAYAALVAHAEREACDQVFARSSSFSDTLLNDYEFYDSEAWNAILSGAAKRSFRPLSEPLVFRTEPKTCARVWRTAYLRSNDLEFPEGRLFEDIGVHLRALALNGRVGILDIQGLFYRAARSGALTLDKSRKRFDVIGNLKEALATPELQALPATSGAQALVSIMRICTWCKSMIDLRLHDEFERRLAECYALVPRSWVKELFRLDGRAARRFVKSYIAAMPLNRRPETSLYFHKHRQKAKRRKASASGHGWLGLGCVNPDEKNALAPRARFSDYRTRGPGPATLPYDTTALFCGAESARRAARFALGRPRADVLLVDSEGGKAVAQQIPNLKIFASSDELGDHLRQRRRDFGLVDLGLVQSEAALAQCSDLRIDFLSGEIDALQADPAAILAMARKIARRGYHFSQSDGAKYSYKTPSENGPAVSVVVPVYNVQDYLDQCIGSLSRQTLADREIILVDDGATDRSSAICDEWAARDNTIRVIHKANGGCASARQAGLEAARGEYVTFVDGDDWVDETMLERLFHKCLLTGDDVAEGGWCFAFPSGATDDQTPWETSQCYPAWGGTLRRPNVASLVSQPAIWRRLYRRSFLMDQRIAFDARLRRFDDMPFQFETLTRVGDLAYVDHCLTFYRQNREGQDIGATDDRLFVHFPITASMREAAMRSGLRSTYKNFLKIQYNTHKWAASIIKPELAKQYRLYMARDMFGPEQLESSIKTLQRLTKEFPKLRRELIGLFLLYLTQARWVTLPQASDVR